MDPWAMANARRVSFGSTSTTILAPATCADSAASWPTAPPPMTTHAVADFGAEDAGAMCVLDRGWSIPLDLLKARTSQVATQRRGYSPPAFIAGNGRTLVRRKAATRQPSTGDSPDSLRRDVGQCWASRTDLMRFGSGKASKRRIHRRCAPGYGDVPANRYSIERRPSPRRPGAAIASASAHNCATLSFAGHRPTRTSNGSRYFCKLSIRLAGVSWMGSMLATAGNELTSSSNCLTLRSSPGTGVRQSTRRSR